MLKHSISDNFVSSDKEIPYRVGNVNCLQLSIILADLNRADVPRFAEFISNFLPASSSGRLFSQISKKKGSWEACDFDGPLLTRSQCLPGMMVILGNFGPS